MAYSDSIGVYRNENFEGNKDLEVVEISKTDSRIISGKVLKGIIIVGIIIAGFIFYRKKK